MRADVNDHGWTWHHRVWMWLLPMVVATLLPSCRSLGREVNQALPEFLRSEPGADEIERFEKRRRVFNRTPEESARARQDFESAKAQFEEGAFDQACVNFELYLESYPDTPEDREARFLLIRCFVASDEYGDAKRAWLDYLGNYPVSVYGVELEKIGYDMALSYLRGDQDFLFFDESKQGVTLLEDLVRHFPSGAYSDDARWDIGNYWFDDDDWIQAQAAYTALVVNHTDSPWAGRAQYNIGLCRLNRVKGSQYDERNMLDAVAAFEEYERKFPEGDRVAEAREHVRNLRELLCGKQVLVAEWYVARDQPRAAMFFLIRAINRFPDTQTVVRAQSLLQSLRDETDNVAPVEPPAVEAVEAPPTSLPTSGNPP